MTISPTAVRILGELLENRTGQQLSENRLWRVDTVLSPLMREQGIGSLDELARMIGTCRDSELGEAAVEALLNNETSFFRDPPFFDQLTSLIGSRIRDQRAAKRHLRLWCAGCSTGQEAYSLGIYFAENPMLWDGWTIDILATDVSRRAIRTARAGIYSQFEIQRGLPVRQMLRWFESDDEQWRAVLDLRRRINFQVHSLIDPAPSNSFDVILCRNVLLYFTGPIRNRVFDRLAYAITPDGLLMLGAGETVLGQTTAFESSLEMRGLYRRAGEWKLAASG